MRKNNWKVHVDGRGKSVDEIFGSLLYSRGVQNICDFLTPSSGNILHPAELPNIDSAANVVIRGIENKSRFLIYADVDTDGCSSAAIIYHYLKNFDIEAETFINKEKDHGIQDYFKIDPSIDILIVVDSINDDPSVYLDIMNYGIDVVVLDHHVPTQAVLDVQDKIHLVSSANNYSNPHLSGSGVCWKFVCYLDTELQTSYSNELIDLAAVGIIADVCSVGPDSMENRAICNQAFGFINNVGLRTLVGKDTMDAQTIGFTVGPLINAANRMGANELALQLFLVNTTAEAKQIIKQLQKLKDLQKETVSKLMPMMDEEAKLQLDYKVMVFFPKDCGCLAGLLATKAADKYSRPVFVLHDTGDGFYRGSMRSVGTIDLRKIINDSGYADCQGHETSAGISIPSHNLQPLLDYLEYRLEDLSTDGTKDVDLVIDRMQITPFLLNKLNNFNRISGPGFPSVCVLIENVKKYQLKPLSQGKHLCIDSSDMKFIQWNFQHWEDVYDNGVLSAVGRLEESFFMGKRSIQMLMDDFIFEVAPTPTSLW